MKNQIIFGLIFLLSGCAGLHSIPPNNYSTTIESDLTTRVAFDQYGNIYPDSPPYSIPQLESLIGKNEPFDLAKEMRKLGEDYDDEIQDKIYRDTIKKIEYNQKLAGEFSRTIFLIHGYNNSFNDASKSYSDIKKHLHEQSDNKYSFVEIYWDGLYKGPRSALLPVFYWGDATLNSDIGGQVGFRKLLNRLPNNTDFYVITHSRGAGVLFSAIANPSYKSGYEPPVYENLNPNLFNKVRIVSIAPAIGKAHISPNIQNNLPKDTKVLIGYNFFDLTVRKFLISLKAGTKIAGDTSLTNDNSYFNDLESQFNKEGKWIQRVKYKNLDHGVDTYFSKTNKTNCLLWAASIIDTKPPECSLVR